VIPPTTTAPVDEEATEPVTAKQSSKAAIPKSTTATAIEAPVGAVTRRKSLIMANANAQSNKTAPVSKKEVPVAAAKHDRRASRKNSRNDDIDEQRIEARNHATKKVRVSSCWTLS